MEEVDSIVVFAAAFLGIKQDGCVNRTRTGYGTVSTGSRYVQLYLLATTHLLYCTVTTYRIRGQCTVLIPMAAM